MEARLRRVERTTAATHGHGVRANRPWRLAARQDAALIAALALGVYGAVTADIWRVSTLGDASGGFAIGCSGLGVPSGGKTMGCSGRGGGPTSPG